MMDILKKINAKKIFAGQNAEQQACKYLEKKGFTLLTRNYRCRSGEIDLIMQDCEEIVFVEVRVRNNLDFGSAVESVNYQKQQKIIKTANTFLSHKNWVDKVNCRFDVIGISYANTKASLEWIKDAFTAHNF
jgi:putative endonuclease